jgi:two-component system, cell cycle sensor histidine kinase and response regulator CckA
MARILIVDDERSIRHTLGEFLRQDGHDVVEAEDAIIATELLRQSEFDVVVTDIILPRVTGVELLRRIQASDPHVQVLMMTGEPTVESASESLRAGAADYLFKPIGKKAILHAVTTAARIKSLEDHRRHLEADNFAHRENLERLVAERTEQLRASEERARELSRFNQATLDALTAHICVLAEDGTILAVNHAGTAFAIANSPIAALTEVGANYLAVCDAATGEEQPVAQAAARGLRAVARGDLPAFTMEYPSHSSGEQRWFVMFATRFPDSTPVRIVVAHENITARKQSEERLREQAALLDAANDAIVVHDLDLKVLYWNRAAEQLYGWPQAEALDRRLTDLVQQESKSAEPAHTALKELGSWSGELQQSNRAGKTMTVFSRWTLLRDELGNPGKVLTITADLSEKRQLEAQFLRAQRLEGVGALASGIAHDLNNILAPVLMTAPMLRETISDPDSRAMLDTVESCAQRGADIIKQLLTFARGKPGARVPLPVRHLMRDLEKIIRETFPRDIRPAVDISPDLWLLLGDATQIHQALMNLCVNARDAMPDGGTLTLSARNLMVDAAFAAMAQDAKPGRHVCVTVSDTGTGIPPDALDHIFDPFFTTKEVGKGTGLGLATVLGIVRGHEGFIRVHSRPGQGTTFELCFPASPHPEPAPVASQKINLPRGQEELILLVDDEAAVRDSLRRILETRGYRVVTASNGAEGLSAFSLHRAEIRVVLTDMMMPVMNGPTMVNALHALDPQLPILGMSGLPERSGVKGFEQVELSALLVKPFTGAELLRALHDVLQPQYPIG